MQKVERRAFLLGLAAALALLFAPLERFLAGLRGLLGEVDLAFERAEPDFAPIFESLAKIFEPELHRQWNRATYSPLALSGEEVAALSRA